MNITQSGCEGETFDRVYIVSESRVVLEGLSALVNREPDLKVCGAFAEPDAALRELHTGEGPVAILSYLSRVGSWALAKSIKRKYGHIRLVVVCSSFAEQQYNERIFRARAFGFLMLDDSAADILTAIRKALAGEVFLGSGVAEAMATAFSMKWATFDEIRRSVDQLSDRELEVFRLYGKGFLTRQIAEQLGLGSKTIQTFSARIKEKMGFRDAAEMTRAAVRWEAANSDDLV